MQIISVKVKELHKYINSKITFNTDLSIITGVNGSGKTSILSLIESVLRLDVNKISETQFKEFHLLIVFNKKEYNISIVKKSSNKHEDFTFIVNNDFIITRESKKGKQLFTTKRSSLIENFAADFEEKTSDPNSNLNVFSKINTPMLIGLNRRISSKNDEFLHSVVFSEQNNFSNEVYLDDSDYYRDIDSFDIALAECQKLINFEFKRIKKYETAQLKALRNALIMSSFSISKISDDLYTAGKMKFEEVKARKAEIIEILKELDLNEHSFYPGVTDFFNRLEELYEKAFRSQAESMSDMQFTLEFLLNLSQVERMFV